MSFCRYIFRVITIFTIFFLLAQILIYFLSFSNFQPHKNVKKLFVNFLSEQNSQILSKLKLEDKISWEDLKFIAYESRRRGPGENGVPFNLTDPKDIQKNDYWYKKEGFYVIASNKISVDRSLKENRPEICKSKLYLRHLPKVSIIITFHNEIFSILLRCIHAVLNRSPSQLIHEIILVDDASTYKNLGMKLEKYISNKIFDNKIRIHRNKKREGLIRSRMFGARLSQGEVLIFLDSHMEVTTTWLPPLLEPLVYYPNIATSPIIKGMSHSTFALDFVGYGSRGMFDWAFRYQWYSKGEKPELGENFELPCITGGAYAIRRDLFFKLGGYDEEMEIYNGENFEISLKLWLCSGGILAIPCSGVLHLSKMYTAHRHSSTNSDFNGRNLKRVAEVWLDDYKKYFYQTNQARYDKIDAGNLSDKFKLKEELKCKPFQFYLDHVAKEMLEMFPIEPKYVYGGSLQVKSVKKCLGLVGMNSKIPVELQDCSEDLKVPNQGQDLLLRYDNSIQYNDYNHVCLDAAKLNFLGCHGSGGNQGWIYNPQTGHLKVSYLDQCLAGGDLNNNVYIETCNPASENQKWTWSLRNETAVEKLRIDGRFFKWNPKVIKFF